MNGAESRFIIYGNPIAKGRPRLGRYGTYTPQKTVDYENLVRLSYLQQCNNRKLSGYIRAEIELYFQIPKRTGKADRWKMKSGQIRHDKRPDADNCIKAVCDALNGIAYDDDSQIVSVRCEKYYGEIPQAVIRLEEIS